MYWHYTMILKSSATNYNQMALNIQTGIKYMRMPEGPSSSRIETKFLHTLMLKIPHVAQFRG
jgi:hypothetical protein